MKQIDVHLIDGSVVTLASRNASDDDVAGAIDAVMGDVGYIKGQVVGTERYAMIPARSVRYCEARGLDALSTEEPL